MAEFWTESYRTHFQKYFRKPFDIQVYHDPDGFSLKVAIHDWAVKNHRVYASMGLADKLVANEEDDFGEVILFSDVPDKEVPQIFINALFFILRNDIPLGSRFSVGGIDQMRADFARRHRKSALYFTLAQDENETFNKVRNGEEFGRVYQAFFIAPDEDAFLDRYGPDEFEKRLQRKTHGAENRSIRRPSFLSLPEEKDEPKDQDAKTETGIKIKEHADGFKKRGREGERHA